MSVGLNKYIVENGKRLMNYKMGKTKCMIAIEGKMRDVEREVCKSGMGTFFYHYQSMKIKGIDNFMEIDLN